MTSAFAVVIAIGLILRLHDGYVRRKPHWASDSWKRFRGALLLVGAWLMLPLLMGIAVDAGLYAWIGASQLFRGLWVTAIIILMFGGVCAGVVLTNWFARGDPTRPCPPVLRPSQWFRP